MGNSYFTAFLSMPIHLGCIVVILKTFIGLIVLFFTIFCPQMAIWVLSPILPGGFCAHFGNRVSTFASSELVLVAWKTAGQTW